jgi:hypothetical protein
MTDDYNLRQPPQYDSEQEMGQTTANSALPELTPQQERGSKNQMRCEPCPQCGGIVGHRFWCDKVRVRPMTSPVSHLEWRGMKGEADNG